jgi:membrane-associated protease RseP (regulator of RpoE activity)
VQQQSAETPEKEIMDAESFLTLDVISAVLFVLLLGAFLIRNRARIAVQKIIWPLFYIVMYRTKIGLATMERWSTKYRETIKLFGYFSIGIAFFGMLVASFSVVYMIVQLIFQPLAAEAGVSMVLPFTNVPGIGYLSFWHFIIAIFILMIVHEFSHGIVARAHGVEVKSSGFAVIGILAPILPAAFVEPDEEKMKKKEDIVQYSVFAAGPVSNIMLALLLFLAFPALNSLEDRMTIPEGFSYTLINNSLPAAQSGMTDSTIYALNGQRMDDYTTFAYGMLCVKPGDNVTLSTKKGNFSMIAAVNPSDEKRGFIGIKPQQNERDWKPEYQKVGPVFGWFKELFKWIMMLNFLIGLTNLLPIAIVDGGRMFQIALTKTVKDRKRANKIFGLIAILFIIFLLFGLLTSWFGNPFALLK